MSLNEKGCTGNTRPSAWKIPSIEGENLAGGSGKLASLFLGGEGTAASPKLVTVVRRDSPVTHYFCRPRCWAPGQGCKDTREETTKASFRSQSLLFCSDLCLDLASRQTPPRLSSQGPSRS